MSYISWLLTPVNLLFLLHCLHFITLKFKGLPNLFLVPVRIHTHMHSVHGFKRVTLGLSDAHSTFNSHCFLFKSQCHNIGSYIYTRLFKSTFSAQILSDMTLEQLHMLVATLEVLIQRFSTVHAIGMYFNEETKNWPRCNGLWNKS